MYTGWGKPYASGSAQSRLHEITVPVVDHEKCRTRNREYYRKVTKTMMCMGFYDGVTFKSACHGDSGGPLSCYDTRNSKWKLFGIVSWGDRTCNALEKYNVFT